MPQGTDESWDMDILHLNLIVPPDQREDWLRDLESLMSKHNILANGVYRIGVDPITDVSKLTHLILNSQIDSRGADR